MARDAKLGLVVGLGLVLTIGLVFYRKEPPSANAPGEHAASAQPVKGPPDPNPLPAAAEAPAPGD